MPEVYLLLRVRGDPVWAFANEDDIIESLRISYGAFPNVTVQSDRDMYTVRWEKEGTIQNEVFVVQRVTVYGSPTHL